MTASSVTGVGQGSADKAGQKGSEHQFLGVDKLIGVRVVHAGTVSLSASSGTVTFPKTLSGAATDYIVLVSPQATGTAYASSVAVSGFTMNGVISTTVSYAVVRLPNATVQVN